MHEKYKYIVTYFLICLLLSQPAMANSLTAGEMEYVFGNFYNTVQVKRMTIHEMRTTEADGWFFLIVQVVFLLGYRGKKVNNFIYKQISILTILIPMTIQLSTIANQTIRYSIYLRISP